MAAVLTPLAIFDHRHNRLPDQVTLPLLWTGLVINCYSVFTSPTMAIIGAAGGYLCIRSIHDIQVVFTDQRGIGLGDAKLLGALGAWLGWHLLPTILVSGSLITLVVYARRRNGMPFGIGLSIAGFLVGMYQVFSL